MKPILITGCGRSGTLYTATLLQKLGVPCHHEVAFRPPVVGTPTWTGIEVAWLAAPYILDAKVFHQIREPIAVINSFLRARNFVQDDVYRLHIYRFLPHLKGLSAVEQAMAYYVEWNEFVVQPHIRYRIEDVGATEWIEWLGLDVQPIELPKNINSTGVENEYTWETLPQGELLVRLKEAAKKYGYGSGSSLN